MRHKQFIGSLYFLNYTLITDETGKKVLHRNRRDRLSYERTAMNERLEKAIMWNVGSMKWFACLVCLFATFVISSGNLPVKKDRKYYESRGEIVWDVHTNEKIISLTFDDGPDPRITPQILDLLKQYKAKATFFILGSRVRQYPELVRRQVEEGHELSNHTYSHVYFRKGTDKQQYLDDVRKAQEVIAEISGQSPRLFRPPGGYYNDTVVDVAKSLGVQIVMWSWHQDTKDWRNPGVNHIVNKVLSNVRSGDIILMHDQASGHSQTVEALKIILPELVERGYKLVTVSELLTHHKTVSN